MGQVAVYSDVERRRRWSDDEERLQILNEAFSPGAVVTQVARHYDISTDLIYTWRRKLCGAQIEPAAALPDPGFVEAVVAEDASSPRPHPAPVIVVDLPRGRRVSVFPAAAPATVVAVLKALR